MRDFHGPRGREESPDRVALIGPPLMRVGAWWPHPPGPALPQRSEPERRQRRARRREGRRGQLAKRPLDPPMVVVEPPPVHQQPRLGQRPEDLRREQLVPQPTVEALHDPVLLQGDPGSM